MLYVFLKRGSKAMRYLPLSFLLGLTQTVSATGLFQGDWNVSPTMDVAIHQSDISSDKPDLIRSGTVVSTNLATKVKYKSKQYNVDIEHKWVGYRYSDTDENSLDYQDIKLSNTLFLWRRDLVLSASYQRYNEIQDTIRGSFTDDMYSRENRVTRFRRDYFLRYDLPTKNNIDLTFRNAYEENETSSLDRLAPVFSDYDLSSNMLTFGQYKKPVKAYWKVDLNTSSQGRKPESNVTNHEVRSVLRAPLWKNIKFAAIGNYTEIKNSNAWLYGNDGNDGNSLEYRVLGAGLAWAKSDGSGYVQLTHNWEEPRGRTNLGVDASWRFEDRWGIDYNYEGRFYGNSHFLKFNYTGSRNQLYIGYSERVDVRLFMVANQSVEGIYICQEDINGSFPYSESNCFIPPNGQYNLQPDQAFVPNVLRSFSRESRLTLSKGLNFRWGFDNGLWEHQFIVNDFELRDLEFDRVELGASGEFLGNWRHSSNTYTRYSWRMRNTALNNNESRSVENYYSMGYHYELNRHAEWSVTLQHINKNATEFQYSYEDNRVTLAYQHFFGKKHADRRTLFPSGI
jgi:hypothetical protein